MISDFTEVKIDVDKLKYAAPDCKGSSVFVLLPTEEHDMSIESFLIILEHVMDKLKYGVKFVKNN